MKRQINVIMGTFIASALKINIADVKRREC